MTQRVRALAITGALALAIVTPATAQFLPSTSSPQIPMGLRNIVPFTGLLQGPSGYLPPSMPSNWISPYSQIYYYPVPVYVPVPVMPQLPALQPVQVTIVTLHESVTQAVRVKVGAAVTWVNATNRERTLIVEPAAPSGGTAAPPAASTTASPQTGTFGPNGSFSLAFNQPGTYDYYLQDQPEHRARLTVEQ